MDTGRDEGWRGCGRRAHSLLEDAGCPRPEGDWLLLLTASRQEFVFQSLAKIGIICYFSVDSELQLTAGKSVLKSVKH